MTNLDRLATLEKEASPGPWEASKGYAQPWDAVAGGDVGSGREYWRVTAYDPNTDECWEVPAWSRRSEEHDAKFIAALRNAAAELIAVARAARDFRALKASEAYNRQGESKGRRDALDDALAALDAKLAEQSPT